MADQYGVERPTVRVSLFVGARQRGAWLPVLLGSPDRLAFEAT